MINNFILFLEREKWHFNIIKTCKIEINLLPFFSLGTTYTAVSMEGESKLSL